MNDKRPLHATRHALYRAWAPTDVPDTAEPLPPRVRGPWLAAAPMLLALALLVGGALIVGATAKATANLSRVPKESTVAGAEQMRRQALAVQAFRAREYAVAYGRFAALADDGDAAAALIALAMVQHGPVLFGSEWSLSHGQLQRWGALALREVREHGTLLAEHDRGE